MYSDPQTLFDYLCTIRTKSETGEFVDYKTVNTDVLAWVTNHRDGALLHRTLHERLWALLGCEEDLYLFVDPAGTAMAGAVLSVAVRDLACSGELMRCHTEWNGKTAGT
ncbi:hypothetical protein [Mesorhizobium sp. M0213]|uniref:hypothetical protein n=1 Tax=Mesorhizobium sp. M0213 TaxID=2956917 RepID=UPI0033369D2D